MKKDTIIIHPTDRGACSWYRLKFMSMLLMSGRAGEVQTVVSPFEITDGPTLARTAAIVVGRPYDDETGGLMVSHYRRNKGRYGYNIFLDYDDIMFSLDGSNVIPDYNPFRIDTVAAGKYMEALFSKVDGITVSTKFIKDRMLERFGDVPVTLLPNAVPEFMFGKAPEFASIPVRPKALYAGSMFHFSDGNAGDFEGPWIPWLKKAVQLGEMELHTFGLPWFLEEVKDRVKVHDPVSSVEFPKTIAAIRPDVYLAPLRDNDFNRAKSNLKLLEATAIGAAFLGSGYFGSPYLEAHHYSLVWPETTPDMLRWQFKKVCMNKMEVLKHQRDVMDKEGYWMDSRHYMTRWLKTYLGDNLVVHG